MHIQLTKIFLCTPCNPRQGLALWTTTLGLLPLLTVASAPHVENLPKPIAKQLECILISQCMVTGDRIAAERTEGVGIFFQRGSQIYKKSALIKLRPPISATKIL